MTEQCRQSLVYVLKHRNFFYLRELETNVRGMESVVQLPAEEVADVGTLEGITAAANKHQLGGQIEGVVQARSISVPFQGCRYASVYVVLEIPLDTTTVDESFGGRFLWLSIVDCRRRQKRGVLCETDLRLLEKVVEGRCTPFQQLTESRFKKLLDEDDECTPTDGERALLDGCGLDGQDCELVIQLFVHYSWPHNFLTLGSFRKLVAELKLIPDAERVDSYFRAFCGRQRGVLGFNQLLFGLGAMNPANEDGLRYRYVFRQFAENVDTGMTGDEFRSMIADILRARARSNGSGDVESVSATQVNEEAQAYAHLLEKGEQPVLRWHNFLDHVAMRQLPGVSGLFRSCAGIKELVKKYADNCERTMPKLEDPFQGLANDSSSMKSRTAGKSILSTRGPGAEKGNQLRRGLKRNMVEEDAATLSPTGTGTQTGESSTPPVKRTICVGVPEDPPGKTLGVVRDPVIMVPKVEEIDLDSPPVPGTGTVSRKEQQDAGVQSSLGGPLAGGQSVKSRKRSNGSKDLSQLQLVEKCRAVGCSGKFKNATNRLMHEQDQHKAYFCDWCGKHWPKSKSLINHKPSCPKRGGRACDQ